MFCIPRLILYVSVLLSCFFSCLYESESQFQAYRIIEATAAPILREFLTLGIHHWSFATLRFEDTRYFLKQQEKMISDTFEQGMISKERFIFDITVQCLH